MESTNFVSDGVDKIIDLSVRVYHKRLDTSVAEHETDFHDIFWQLLVNLYDLKLYAAKLLPMLKCWFVMFAHRKRISCFLWLDS